LAYVQNIIKIIFLLFTELSKLVPVDPVELEIVHIPQNKKHKNINLYKAWKKYWWFWSGEIWFLSFNE